MLIIFFGRRFSTIFTDKIIFPAVLPLKLPIKRALARRFTTKTGVKTRVRKLFQRENWRCDRFSQSDL